MIQHNIIFDAHEILLKIDRYIKEQGIQFEVSATAPSTYEELRTQCNPYSITVWSGASDRTIWGYRGNHLFRVFHDHLHLKYGLDFSDESERQVCELSIALLGLDGIHAMIMQAEICGQLDYKNTHNEFPTDQTQFTAEYVREFGDLED